MEQTHNMPGQTKYKRLQVGYISIIQPNFRGDKEAQFHRSHRELEQASGDMGFDLHVYPEMVVTAEQARSARAYMEEGRVDFLLIQNTSLASGLLITELAGTAPWTGLWAVKEERDHGYLPQNSFCGVNLNGSSMYGYLLDKKPYKWFYGDLSDPYMGPRFAVTVKALTALVNLRGANILHIGGTAPGFIGFYNDERQLRHRLGIRVTEMEYGDLRDLALSYADGEVATLAAEMAAEADCLSALARDSLPKNARVYRAMAESVEREGAAAIAMSCWPRFRQDWSFTPCAVFGRLNENGVITACEGDILSAASMLLLRCAADFEPILMDLVSFDDGDESVQLWHCGVGSKTYAKDGAVALDTHYNPGPLDPERGWLPAGPVATMEFAPQPLTCMRFTQDAAAVLTFSGEIVPGKPVYHGSGGWLGQLAMDGAALPAAGLINTIMTNGFPHHYPLVRGKVESAVREAAAWLGIPMLEQTPYRDYLQIE